MVIDFSTLYDVPRYMDKLFEDFWGPSISRRRMAYPPLNISEDEGALYVKAEIPGVAMEDLELTLTDKGITLKGERKSGEGKYFRQERPTGVFQRIVSLNVPIDRNGVKATMTNGVLEVVLPKSEEVKPKKIDIEIS